MNKREKDRKELNPILLWRFRRPRIRGAESVSLGYARPYGKNRPGDHRNPILANFREAWTFCILYLDARRTQGSGDRPQNSRFGYLTRRLVDVAQEVIVAAQDCGTLRGIGSEAIIRNGEGLKPQRSYSRIHFTGDIVDPVDGTVIVKRMKSR